jgi:PAS domain S-box-containing protein
VLGIHHSYKNVIWFGWSLSALFSTTILTTDWLVIGLYRYWWGYYPRYGWLSLPFITFFFLMILLSSRHYWKEYRKAAPGPRKVKIWWLLIAFAGTYVASLDYLAKFGIALYPFGYLAVFCWLVFVAQAIWRYQLVDITPAFAAHQVLSTMADALLVFDQGGIIRVANQAAGDLFGRPERALIGTHVSALHDGFMHEEKLHAVLRLGRVRGEEMNVLLLPDRMTTLDMTTSVIRDRSGHVAAIVCILRDVTDRKLAEKALKASEERFRSVTQSALDGIVSADSSGRILTWNNGAERIFGYQPHEILGLSLTLLMPERYRAAHTHGLQRMQAMRTGQVIGKTVELSGLRKDGSEFPLELSLAMWRTGEQMFYGGIIRDLTERKQAEHALRESEEQLRQAQKIEALGRLTGGIAHDFNNLLTVINGYSDLLLTLLGPDDPSRASVEQIKYAGDRSVALTRQLLAFSRRQILEPKVVDLNAVVGNMEKLLRRLIGEDIHLVTNTAPSLGCVKVDPSQLEQVIMNLAVNARDAMPDGGRLTIQTANVEPSEGSTAAPNRDVMLVVSDTGCGMNAETQARMFEPFFTPRIRGKAPGWDWPRSMELSNKAAAVSSSQASRARARRLLCTFRESRRTRANMSCPTSQVRRFTGKKLFFWSKMMRWSAGSCGPFCRGVATTSWRRRTVRKACASARRTTALLICW